jgi:hypothetical protein
VSILPILSIPVTGSVGVRVVGDRGLPVIRTYGYARGARCVPPRTGTEPVVGRRSPSIPKRPALLHAQDRKQR